MKLYRGYRRMHQDWQGKPTSCECVVTVEVRNAKTGRRRCRYLRPRNDIRDHSPTGFEWGYGGSGPAQLALALVADCCGPAMAVPSIYQRVKAKLVAAMPHEGWMLTEEALRGAITEAQEEMHDHQKGTPA